MYKHYEDSESYKNNISDLTPDANVDLKAHALFRLTVVKDDKPSKVDAVGYVDPNKRLKQMIEAGVRIDSWQHAVYDYENGIEADDGIKIARERNDWDDLDMLSDAMYERVLYREEMYRYYRKALEAESAGSKAPEAPPGASVQESVTRSPVPSSGVSEVSQG